MERQTYCVPCLFGLEEPVGTELRRMNMDAVQVENGRVLFEGDFSDMVRANLWLRMGERVLLRLGRFPAESFEALFQGVRSLPLEQFVSRTGKLPVKGHCLNSKLHSVPDCQAIVKKAAAERLGAHYGMSWLPETGETFQLQFSIMKDVAEVFLDTTGAGLHKRGYRAVGNDAPLRETLAAAMVEVAHWRGREFFWDPFCGSGTIVIEAALIAKNRAPGLSRGFSAERWPCVEPQLWRRAREAARDAEYHGEYRILGSDVDPKSLQIACSNAEKAGVDDCVRFEERDATKTELPCEAGVLVCNPPYGERMLEQRSAQRLYQAFGRSLKNADGWRKYVITSEPEFEYYFGQKAAKRRKLYNGMIQCNLYQFFERRT